MDEMQLDFYTKTEVDEKFGGMVIEKISKADFDALTTKDPNTIYFVYDDSGQIVQYVGDAELGSGKAVYGFQDMQGLSAKGTSADIIGIATQEG